MPAITPHAVHEHGAAPVTRLEKVLRGMSVFTMAMTVPQVAAIWIAREADNVSVVSWSAYLLAACLWFAHGIRKRDRTIWVACIGWILLDSAIVVGALLYG